jgi:hypothetical protein
MFKHNGEEDFFCQNKKFLIERLSSVCYNHDQTEKICLFLI